MLPPFPQCHRLQPSPIAPNHRCSPPTPATASTSFSLLLYSNILQYISYPCHHHHFPKPPSQFPDPSCGRATIMLDSDGARERGVGRWGRRWDFEDSCCGGMAMWGRRAVTSVVQCRANSRRDVTAPHDCQKRPLPGYHCTAARQLHFFARIAWGIVPSRPAAAAAKRRRRPIINEPCPPTPTERQPTQHT